VSHTATAPLAARVLARYNAAARFRMKTRFPHAYVLNVLADDHPGIVAAVTHAITQLSGNIDACSQTVVEGYFTLIMVISLPAPIEPEKLAAEVRSGGAGFQVQARRFQPAVARKERGPVERFVLTTFGKDKPGIVRHFSEYLAGKDINIIDLYAHREGEDFLIVSQLEIPVALDIALLQADLEQVAKDESFTVKLQHENIFVATNQLRLN
jgi:predicted amino acid-binding ACT domain protein